MASGDEMALLPPVGGTPDATNPSRLTARGVVAVLDFNATTESSHYWQGVLPPTYGGGGLTITLPIIWESAIANSSVFGVSYAHLVASSTDLDVVTFATENTAIASAPATNGQFIELTIAHLNSEIDGLTAGDRFAIRLSRKTADVNDTATGYAGITGDAIVKET